ncbi:hypothetical protein HMPREF1254_1212 [Prevotella sp. BV3P1]|nr:hypothetical protein HMPREF1254_1212 [Prevotella sp. BV3P1]
MKFLKFLIGHRFLAMIAKGREFIPAFMPNLLKITLIIR